MFQVKNVVGPAGGTRNAMAMHQQPGEEGTGVAQVEEGQGLKETDKDPEEQVKGQGRDFEKENEKRAPSVDDCAIPGTFNLAAGTSEKVEQTMEVKSEPLEEMELVPNPLFDPTTRVKVAIQDLDAEQENVVAIQTELETNQTKLQTLQKKGEKLRKLRLQLEEEYAEIEEEIADVDAEIMLLELYMEKRGK